MFFLKSLDEASKTMKEEDFILKRKEFLEQEQFQLLRKKVFILMNILTISTN